MPRGDGPGRRPSGGAPGRGAPGRGAGPSRGGPERRAGGERDARPERSQRPARTSRPPRPERRERPEAPERPRREQPQRPPRAPRAERPDRLPTQQRPTRRERPPRPPREDLVYGRNPVLEAARAGRVRRLLLETGLEADPRLAELTRIVPDPERVDQQVLDRLAEGGVHQGVVAEVAPRVHPSLRQLLDRRPPPSLLVALDSVLDPHNLGAILRSAEAAGADAAIIPERRSAPLSAVAAKASAGATEHLTIARVAGLAAAVPELRRAGIWCVALDPRGELAPWEFDFTAPVCVVVGGEGQGVHRLVRERCDARVRLPMAGRIESLNASAAAAALLYEVARQRASKARR